MQPGQGRSVLSWFFRSSLIVALAGIGCGLSSADSEDEPSAGRRTASLSTDAPFQLSVDTGSQTTTPGGSSLSWVIGMTPLDGNPGSVTFGMTDSDPPFSGRVFFIPGDTVRPGESRWAVPAPNCDVALGDHELTITGTREDGATASVTGTVTVVVGGSPRALFQVSQQGLDFQFNEVSSLAPCAFDLEVVRWSWSFGDGARSTVQNPSHTYGVPGDYHVNLAVTDTTGATYFHQRRVTATKP